MTRHQTIGQLTEQHMDILHQQFRASYLEVRYLGAQSVTLTGAMMAWQ